MGKAIMAVAKILRRCKYTLAKKEFYKNDWFVLIKSIFARNTITITRLEL
jgi:hypothetical protein